MLLWLFIAVLTLAVIFGYQKFVLKPKRMMLRYQKAFTQKGFKVELYPFMFLGSFMDLRKQGIRHHGDCYHHEKHVSHNYDVLIYNQLSYPQIDFVNPQLQKAFLSFENAHNYRKLPLSIANLSRTFGEGLVFAQGVDWKYRRKLMNVVFSYDFIMTKLPDICNIFRQSFELMEMEKNCDQTTESPQQFQSYLYDTISQATGNVVMECFFGISSVHEKVQGKSLARFISDLNVDIMNQGYSPIGLLLGARFLGLGLRASDRQINSRLGLYKSIMRDKITARLQESQRSDSDDISSSNKGKDKSSNIISLLLQENRLDLSKNYCLKETNGEKYGVQEILDEFSVFYVAGIETTSHFLLMMIYYISGNPRIKQKLKVEIDKHIKCEEDITVENLKKLVYIDWIESEVTRHYGPANGIFDREVISDHFLMGVPISKNTLISLQPLGTHYDPKYFSDPLEFRPERWENQCKNLPPYVMMGFSGGPRSCIGKHLAYLEAKAGLVVFMLRYQSFNLPKKHFIMDYGFLPFPEPMKMTLHKKNQQ